MIAGDGHALAEIEFVCARTLRPRIQVKRIAAGAPRLVTQPLQQRLAVPTGTGLAGGHEIIDIHVPAQPEIGRDAIARDGDHEHYDPDRLWEAVEAMLRRVVDEAGEVLFLNPAGSAIRASR